MKNSSRLLSLIFGKPHSRLLRTGKKFHLLTLLWSKGMMYALLITLMKLSTIYSWVQEGSATVLIETTLTSWTEGVIKARMGRRKAVSAMVPVECLLSYNPILKASKYVAKEEEGTSEMQSGQTSQLVSVLKDTKHASLWTAKIFFLKFKQLHATMLQGMRTKITAQLLG